jgi:hypothetical protein
MSNTIGTRFRLVALIGTTLAAWTFFSAAIASAEDIGKAPRPDFPGAKQAEQVDAGAAPRPDFPGAKQSETQKVDLGQAPRPDFPGAKQGDNSAK